MMMKVTCCFKMGHDPDKVSQEEWRQAAEDGFVDLRYMKSRIDPQDESGLELALRFRDGCAEIGIDTQLEAVSAGDRDNEIQIRNQLQTLAALGFDRISLVKGGRSFSPQEAAELLAKYVRDIHQESKQKNQLIICGSRSSEGGSRSVPLILAELLGIRCITGVTEFTGISDDAAGAADAFGTDPVDKIAVKYRRDGLLIQERVSLPVLLAVGDVQKSFLRVPTLKQRMASASAGIEEVELEADADEPAELTGFSFESQDREGRLMEAGSAEEAARVIYRELAEKGLVNG